jgi:hypothetical protein
MGSIFRPRSAIRLRRLRLDGSSEFNATELGGLEILTQYDGSTGVYSHASGLLRPCWRRVPGRFMGVNASPLSAAVALPMVHISSTGVPSILRLT